MLCWKSFGGAHVLYASVCALSLFTTTTNTPTCKWILSLHMLLLSLSSASSFSHFHLTIAIVDKPYWIMVADSSSSYINYDRFVLFMYISLTRETYKSFSFFFLLLLLLLLLLLFFFFFFFFSRDSQKVLKEVWFFNWHYNFFLFQWWYISSIKKKEVNDKVFIWS